MIKYEHINTLWASDSTCVGNIVLDENIDDKGVLGSDFWMLW